MSKVLERIEAMSKRKLRSKTRPYRASTLLDKAASKSGADLRIPLMGGTKFPTSDSGISEAQKKLKEHQNVGTPKMERMSVKSITPSYSTADVMPKIGEAMNLAEDPLIQFLKKEATLPSKVPTDGEAPPKKVSTDSVGAIDDNTDDMALQAPAQELTSEDPTATADDSNEWRKYLAETIGHKEGISPKYTEKDFDYSPGIVDRSLAKV